MPLPPYKIIYNWDGAPHGYDPVPQSMPAFLDKVYAPLEDTQVDALFWSVGDDGAPWENQLLDAEPQDLRYDSAAAYTHGQNICQMLERGEDPHAALIERGHQLGLQVYASMRMNDNHFGGAQISDLAQLYKNGRVSAMRAENPHWLLGDRTSEWFALSWNMAVPQVRQHRFNSIETVCKNWDWDGVELDWQRHAFHFPDDEGYRLRYLLTDLQRAVRRLTDDLAQKRGRPFYLAARVAGSLEMCYRLGYDVPCWIEEGLVDILIPAGGAVTDAAIDVSDFVALCRNTEVALYPGFDSNLPDPFVGPEEPGDKERRRIRAIASRYHQNGASGIYVFNWHANRQSKRQLLCQIGTPETLANTDKIYAATHRFVQRQGDWRGAYRIDRIRGQVPVDLHPTLTAKGLSIPLEIAETIPPNSTNKIQLRLRFNEWVDGDQVEVTWNDDELPQPQQDYCALENPNPPGGAFQPPPRWRTISQVSSAVWLGWDLSTQGITQGYHHLAITLAKRHSQLQCPLVLTDVELAIQH